MNDPLGTALLDYLSLHRDEKNITVHCNIADDDVLPVELLFRQLPKMSVLEKTALKHCRGKVLDIGAGAGCHSLELKKRGLDATSIDISAGAVAAMKQRGLVNVLRQHVMDISGQRFDTLLMLMNGIGLVGTLNGFDQFLHKANGLLNPGGQIIFDTSDIEYLYLEEDGSKFINLNAPYYGEVEYQMEYKGIKGEVFNWLYLDYITLTDHAIDNHYDVELLYDDERFNYLVRLTPIPV